MSQAKEPSLSLADQVAIELREDIIGGRLLPGMPLVESELVNAYNASRNTVREALHHLGREGLTSYVRNKGVIVRRLGVEEVRDIFKVRRTLELQAIAADVMGEAAVPAPTDPSETARVSSSTSDVV